MKGIYVFLLFVTLNVYAIEIRFINSDGTINTKDYDISITELSFFRGKTESISGLEKLSNLQRISFEMTAFIKDFGFLKNLNNVEELIFKDVQLENVDFLYSMPSLKRVIIQGGTINKKIDLSGIPKIEYLEITNAGLDEFPVIITSTTNIKVINIAYNRITNISLDQNDNIMIIATGNPLCNINKNVFTGDLNQILPIEYQKYIR